MKLHDILNGSDYSLELFTPASIEALENRINEKVDKKGKLYYSVNCIIRGKEIKLTPEEVVRQLYTEQLISQYGYSQDRIAFEYPIYFGREAKRADIVIRDADDANVAYIIVEVKKPKAKDGREQLKSYTHATGASMAVWTNGTTIAYYQRQNPNFFKDIPNIPRATETLAEILQAPFTMNDLIREDKLTKTGKSLKDLVLEMEDESIMLSTIAECENACATHDAYELSPYVYNLTSEYDSTTQSKLVNTGTIDKFSNRWGVKDITYLGAKYVCPVVDKKAFASNFGKAYIRKTLSKKLIFKGLNLLDGFIDLSGNYIPGKSTLVICSDNINDLKFLCGLLNSKLAIFYIKSKYASSSYCGGITFSKDMINNFPVSSLAGFKEKVILIVDKILDSGYSVDLNKLLNETIYSSYDLSSAEIQIIEQSI